MDINKNGLYDFTGNKGDYIKSGDENWCKNWTFTPRVLEDGTIIMIDTYWGNHHDSLQIKITEDNINEFVLIFDTTEVEQIEESQKYKYKEYHCVAVGSGGWNYPRYFIDKGTKKNVNKVLEKIDSDIGEYK